MSIRYLLLLVALPLVAKASPTTIGCVTQGLLGGLIGGLLGGTYNNILSAADCASRCASTSRTFSYWSSGVSRCYCSNTGVDISSLASTAVTVGQSSSTPLCAASNYHVQTIGFPYQLQNCAVATDITSVTFARSNPKTVNECLTACSDYPFAMVGLGASATCTCGRGTTISSTGATRCASGVTAVYRNSGVVEPGPSSRKKKRKLAEDRRLCPGSLSACLIGGQGDSFECLDTNAELESCGGCTSGAVDSILDIRIGVDCSATPGVALGGATCLNGRCRISRCRRGWNLGHDKCLKQDR